MSRSWKRFLLAMVTAFGLVTSAQAGNIVLTGHDDDFHQQFDGGATSQPGLQIKAMAAFARNGSSLPVLTFDHGSQLTGGLTALSIPFTNIDPDTASQATIISAINSGSFSAIAVASDQSCGGCDNTTTSSANLSTAAVKAAIASFVNNGHGIFAFAGAANANYYNFLPNTAAPFGSPPSTGFVQTPAGLMNGIPAVNGDPSHNFFNEPGMGTDPAFSVFERNSLVSGNPAITIGIAGALININSFGSVPEPGTLALAGLALAGVAGYRLRRRKASA